MRVLDAQKDDVVGAALLEAGPHAVDLRDKSVEAETLLELSIIPSRPHGQRPTGPERRVRGSDACVVVELVIGRRRERRGTVVHVQQYRVESAGVCTKHVADVPDIDPNTAVVQRVSCQRPERPAVPLDDRRHELGHRHHRVRREQIQRRT